VCDYQFLKDPVPRISSVTVHNQLKVLQFPFLLVLFCFCVRRSTLLPRHNLSFIRPVYRMHILNILAGVAQCLATDWTTGRLRFDPRLRKEDFSSNLCVQTGSGAHPASCQVGTGGPLPGGKALPGRDANHSPHLVSRS
jgi:hypothetical protein